jgi:hypothetical protein
MFSKIDNYNDYSIAKKKIAKHDLSRKFMLYSTVPYFLSVIIRTTVQTEWSLYLLLVFTTVFFFLTIRVHKLSMLKLEISSFETALQLWECGYHNHRQDHLGIDTNKIVF